MKMILMVTMLGGLIFGYLLFFLISTVSHDPEVWHVDPLLAEASTSPNDYRVAPLEMTKQPVDTPAPVINSGHSAFASSCLTVSTSPFTPLKSRS